MKLNNQIDRNLYSEKSLFLLNIRDLRALGRKFGVPSPTTMKKQELVDYILKIVYGEVAVPVKNSCGRPSTNEFDMGKFIDKIKSKSDISEALSYVSLENDLGTLKIADGTNKDDFDELIETKVFSEEKGVCMLKTKFFVDSEDDLEIQKSVADKFNLENMDVVEVVNCGEMVKIISVNGVKVRNKFQGVEVCGQNLQAGIKRDFYFSTKEEVICTIEKIIKESKNLDVQILCFGTTNFEELGDNCFVFSQNVESSKIYKKLMIMISKCEKLALENEDMILIFENQFELEEIINTFERDVADRIKKHLQEVLTKFMNLGNIIIYFGVESEREYK